MPAIDGRRRIVRSAIFFAFATLALALPSAGGAAPPSNDAWASASTIGSVPFSDGLDLDGATTEPGEPQICSFKTRSVWYRFTPTSASPVRIALSGGTPGLAASMYRHFGGGVGNLGFEGCVFGSATLDAQAGGTYYLQVGDNASGASQFQLGIEAVPPPPNDAFADARSTGALPYFDVVEMLASTVEAGEPAPTGSPFLGSAWWSFVAPETGSMLINEAGCCGNRLVRVYTGDALESLELVPVTRSFGRAVFSAVAGETYMVQLGHYGGLYGGGSLGISIQKTPNPSAAVFWSPFDPSSYDTIQFAGHGFDPAAFPIDSWSWDFGDGGTGEGQSSSHRYFADGDYDVTLTIRTLDGRTASSTSIVRVRTHDVAITKLAVPQAASKGQTRPIAVSVVAGVYDESVTVQLYRSVPGGYAPVGSLMQSVQARKRATTFAFSYTFTADDAALGKVTFKAVATVSGARDALPADNEVVSLPTKVN